MADKFWSKAWFPGGWFVWEEVINVFYYRVEPYKHNSYMVIDNHTEI
jgi:hypothetical protein